jgi:hypothetical protein
MMLDIKHSNPKNSEKFQAEHERSIELDSYKTKDTLILG